MSNQCLVRDGKVMNWVAALSGTGKSFETCSGIELPNSRRK
jgi:hypothetical protein